MGGCCVGDCCIGDNPVINFFKDIFCSDSGCGYHPGTSDTADHAKKIADELAEMKKNVALSNEKGEKMLLDYINSSLNSLLNELESINAAKYGGKSLNINVRGIKQENEQLQNNVKGHIGRIMNERLVLSDKELKIILDERNDKKRAKNFDSFVDKVRKEAFLSLRDRIEKTVNKQANMVRREISTRITEVEQNMKRVENEYAQMLASKEKGEKEFRENQLKIMYKAALSDVLLDNLK